MYQRREFPFLHDVCHDDDQRVTLLKRVAGRP
jgi:hypothetical protein